MKKTIFTLFLACAVAVTYGQKTVPSERLEEREGVWYEIEAAEPFTGIQEDRHENGQPALRRSIRSGKLNGPVESFYENGALKSKMAYTTGQIGDGIWEEYYENGNPKYRTPYQSGEIDGVLESYYENGQLEYRSTFTRGENTGPEAWYYDNGALQKQGRMWFGNEDGIWEFYAPDGTLREKVRYRGGSAIENI